MLTLDTKPLKDCLILIVDDDQISQEVLAESLSGLARCQMVGSGDEAISFCLHKQPDLIILDLDMPGRDGLSVCLELKRQTQTEDIPVIFVTGTIDVETENNCWRVGAADFVLKPVTVTTLRQRVHVHLQNKLRMELLENMTLIDQLTGLYNRLYLRYELPAVIRQLQREKKVLCAVLIGIDNLKSFNHIYGQYEGDNCLKRVASVVAKTARNLRAPVIRFSGEEFLVFLPDTPLNQTVRFAQEVVDNVYSLSIAHSQGVDSRLTISAGVECCSSGDVSANKIVDTLARVDSKLNKAKAAGKNRICAE